MGTKFPFASDGDAGMVRTESIVTPDDIKDRYLFGIDLTDEQDNELPEKVIQHHINAAVSMLELQLDIIIKETPIKGERYDYRQVDYTEFNFIQLKKRPVSTVTKLAAKFPNDRELINYPKEWFTIEHESGQLQLVPVEGTFSGLIVTQGGSYTPFLFGTRNHWPHMFEIDYIAGFCDGHVPIVLNDIIGMMAAISVFEILGDIVLGAGVSSESTSLDAASTTKTLTASAMYSAYSARIESYRKKLEVNIKVAQKYFQGIPTTVV